MNRRWALVMALLAAVTAAAAAQLPGVHDRERGRIMLRVVRERLERYYYDTTFHGHDLDLLFARGDTLIQRATSNSEIFAIIGQTVMALDDSHTRFIPPGRVSTVEYGWSVAMVGDSCFITDVEPASDAAAQGVAVGDRLVAIDGFVPNRRHFYTMRYFYRALSPRTAVQLVLETPDGRQRTLDVQARVLPGKAVLDLTGEDFWKLIRESENRSRTWRDGFTMVADSILVWQMGSFVSESQVDHGIRRAAHAKVMILDLRGNPGGLVRALNRLVSRVFDRPVTVAVVRRRRGTETDVAKPDDPFQGRLMVLVDGASASASEVFARVVQLEARGVVVGDRTPGLVMQSIGHSLSVGADVRVFYALSTTVADVMMSDSSRLEKAGVTPDAVVVPSGADLAAGNDPALAHALGLAGHTIGPVEAGRLLRRLERR